MQMLFRFKACAGLFLYCGSACVSLDGYEMAAMSAIVGQNYGIISVRSNDWMADKRCRLQPVVLIVLLVIILVKVVV